MVRTNKPYQRSPDTYKRGNPDGPGAWKHDLHTSVKQSLASRQTSFKSRPTLLDRISGGQGKELFPTSSSLSKLYGFGDRPPANTANNPNAGLELLPQNNRVKKGNTSKGRLVDTGLNAALGLGGNGKKSVRRVERPQRSVESVSIMGAARGTTWVKVEHLALGTTADDVMSAFAPAPVLNAHVTSSPPSSTVSVEIEVESRTAAEEIVQRYNGAVADGNTLVLTMIRQSLQDRMGDGRAIGGSFGANMSGMSKVGLGGSAGMNKANVSGRELLPAESSSKMHSDNILASDPRSAIITVADETAARAQQLRRGPSGPSLAQRMSGKRGRGQIGGGSYADMMVD